MSEIRKRLSQVKEQNSSVGSMQIRNQMSEIRCQRAEIRSQRSELDDFRMNEEGFWIMLPSIAPTSRHFSTNLTCSGFNKHPQSHAKSSHVSVSAFSPSASVSLLTKCASYLRFAQASRRFVQTDRDERRIWSISEYFSSAGNRLLALKMSIASAYAF
jgi:hypothetical protein